MFGGLAQLVERLLCKQDVSGSSPLTSINTMAQMTSEPQERILWGDLDACTGEERRVQHPFIPHQSMD